MRLSSGFLRRQPQEPPSTSSSISNAPTSTSTLSVPTSPTASPTTTGSTSPTPTQTSTSSSSSSNKTPAIAAVIAIIVVVSAIIGAFFLLRNLRRKHKNPKYVPTSFLKKRWEQWEPGSHSYQSPETNDDVESISNTQNAGTRPPGRSSNPPSAFDAAARSAVETAAAGVDRNTSVRSVMTLPAYNPHALQNEQVLGREGERGGIDVVIEFPEGADEEESRREEEMEALYQVRLARRRENEEREERRRLRREARERGDYVALREIQARARASSSASGVRTLEELRAEHERIKKERLRAISSVSYADLGIARHDGTRLRANSVESEREGLLGDSASMGTSSQHHQRERSGSSVLSLDTLNSDFPSPNLTRSRANSRGDSPLRRVSTSHTQNEDASNEGRAGSSPEMIEHDDVPLHDPPGYENISLDTPQDEHRISEPPPDYSSPTVPHGPTFDSPEGGASVQRSSSVATVGRRISQLVSRNNSSASATSAAKPESRRSSRGVGGVPQLPSLRLAHLPAIHVDSPSPVVRTIDEDDEVDSRPPSAHHPEE